MWRKLIIIIHRTMKLIKIGNRGINEFEVAKLTLHDLKEAISVIILFCRRSGKFLFCR